jgi:hypothetical protein
VHLRLHAPPGAPRSYSDLPMLRSPPPCTDIPIPISASHPPPCTPHHTRLISLTPVSRTPARTSAGIDPLTSTRSDFHRCIGAHFPCYLTAPTSHRVDAARLRKPAIEPRHRIAPKDIHAARNSSLSLRAHQQSRAISSPSPKHAHGALPEHVRTHPPPPRARARTPASPPANEPLASTPHRNLPVRACPAHRKSRQGAAHTRTFAAAAPAPDDAEVVQPIPGKDEDSKGACAYSARNRFLIRDA